MSTTANTLANIMPKILARGLKVLRQRCIMPQLVNSDYSTEAKEQGDTIDVPIPVAVGTTAVTPAETPPAPTQTTPAKVTIPLSRWHQNEGIHLSDKDVAAINRDERFLPMQLMEAVKALADVVNLSIFNEFKEAYIHAAAGTVTQGVYGYAGTAGTTPFGDAVGVASATEARKILSKQLCPKSDRRGVLDFDAEALAIALAPFSDLDKSGDQAVKIEGEIGRKYGINWYADDQVPTHTAGTVNDGATPNGRTCAVNEAGAASTRAIGVYWLNMDNGAAASLTGTILVGDIISFAGHDQTYMVVDSTQTSAQWAAGVYTAAGNAVADLEFYPPLKVAVADNEVVTVRATHVVNLVFHRDAFAFATRPLVEAMSDLQLGSKFLSMQDPVSGLVMRLEVSRQHKQTVWEFDILWGAKLVRPELCMRIAG